MIKLILILALVLPMGGYSTYTATAYSLKGKTASGKQVRQGIVAADPRILPIGSVISIKGKGQFKVCDTGGKIKGRRLDIWMASRQNAINFGVRKVSVRVISKGQGKC